MGQSQFAPEAHHQMARVMADAVPGARADGPVVTLPGCGVTIECQIDGVQSHQNRHAATIDMDVAGGPFGPDPAFASFTAFSDDPSRAIAEAILRWTDVLSDLLISAGALCTGSGPSAHVHSGEITIHGRRFAAHCREVDDFLAYSAGLDHDEVRRRSRAFAGGELPSASALRSPVAPVLASPHALLADVTVLVDARESEGTATFSGITWPPLAPELAVHPGHGLDVLSTIKDVVLLVPLEPPVWERAALVATLHDIGMHRTAPSQTAGWRGWAEHGGQLMPPLGRAVLEGLGVPLPPDYVAFMTTVSGGGAGPGFGLMPPFAVLEDGLAVAQHEDGSLDVMRTDPPYVGQIRNDAREHGGALVPTHTSFSDWYGQWLNTAVTGAPAPH